MFIPFQSQNLCSKNKKWILIINRLIFDYVLYSRYDFIDSYLNINRADMGNSDAKIQTSSMDESLVRS